MKPRLALLFAFTVFLLAAAQAQYKVSGHVVSDSVKNGFYATVTLGRPTDTLWQKAAITDIGGAFALANVPAGNYTLTVSVVGFEKFSKDITVKDADLELGNLRVVPDSRLLSVVRVNTKVKLFEAKGDKIIVNTAANPVMSGINGLELLEKMPGVTVNRQSETIGMVGKAGVLVMIDDRPSYLSGRELVLFLKTLKSDEIEKVEIISNPSARYDADGANGIINLKTKKGRAFGTNYTLDLGADYSSYKKYGDYFKHNQGLSINSKTRGFTFYGNLNHQRGRDFSAIDETLDLYQPNGALGEHRTNMDLDKGRNDHWTGNFGIDFNLPKRTVFGISLYSTFFDGNKDRTLAQRSDETGGSTFNNLTQLRDDKFRYYLSTLHFGHTFDSMGTALTADLDIVYNKSYNNSDFTTNTIKGAATNRYDNAIRSDNRRVSYIFKSSFERMVSRVSAIEMGIKTRLSNIDNHFADNFKDNLALDPSTFKFFENINAAYFIFSSMPNQKTTFLAGLRMENTNTIGRDEHDAKLTEQHYTNLFPSFSLNRRMSEKVGVSVGYSRRIGRPDANNFNVFRIFSSPLSYSEGNPFIRPSLNNSYTFSTTYKDKYFFELSYVDVKDFATQVLYIDSTLIPGRNLVRSRQENVGGKVSWINFKTFIPVDVTKWWHIDAQGWAGMNLYNYTQAKQQVDISQFYWGGSIFQNFTIHKIYNAEVIAWANSGETNGFETSRVIGAVDFGVRRPILHRKGSLKLSLQDPFNLNYNRHTTQIGNIYGYGTYRWDNRRIVLTFTYNFGNRNVKVDRWQSKFPEVNAERKN